MERLIEMRPWTRWQDWLAVVAGAYALLSPIWTTTTDKATWTLVVLGAVTLVIALGSLAAPAVVATEALIALMGVLFFVSPWVMSYHDINGMAWTAWIVGVVTFLLGASALPVSRSLHQGAVAQH
jgi:hypothetical protein